MLQRPSVRFRRIQNLQYGRLELAREEFDYIVVGGGASGCVAAAQLVNRGGCRVLLLEAGHSHHHPLLDMPPGIFKLIHGSKYMRYHKTIPQEHLDGRAHEIPQGHVLGGGSSVNAQVYMRGRPSDYDEWDSLLSGNAESADWGWNAVLKHFRSIEGNNRFNNERHGIDGPLLVSDPGHVTDFSRWFIQAVQGMGEPFNADFNGPTQRGVGFYQFTNRNGRRSSAAYAYIEPLRNDARLTVKLKAEVLRVVVENRAAVGVAYRQNGEEKVAYARSEVIISAGALVTPKLLMLSGIGPAAHLADHGIPCVADLPGVGANLIDHPEVPITAIANGKHGYFKQGTGWRMIKNGLQFKLFGSGPILTAGLEAGALVNPLERAGEPTIQAFPVPIVYLDREAHDALEDTYGFTITTVVVKPKSRGFVKLRSPDPAAMPIVSPHLLKEEEDMRQMIAGQRFFLEAFRSAPLARHLTRIALPAHDDDENLRRHCKRFVKTNYHPAGTCKMGSDTDSMAVLDARMRVRGVEGLRVSDMSAVPNINAGNTNAPAMMLGDRCADFILD
ncbi:GMC family oxidoreductase N-terminal domain-containing protein [Paraburkholderia sp. CNPSo 3272]|uniref:GMC family oxidoreductase n=1 Tax=Paraburkholderia sp. CNPSo 3272 TaxID=2940931 RepID=UPI0020B7890D|nr:GMC family oxidoreductase N-terminal domain-containing protein [Paraburkholderia sp. CNPSo 3272]MCP3722410.1 GMC family oxidoreductase N-terminal domain-containing protein [Paraburkholderia sp. CNPSo 3272]